MTFCSLRALLGRRRFRIISFQRLCVAGRLAINSFVRAVHRGHTLLHGPLVGKHKLEFIVLRPRRCLRWLFGCASLSGGGATLRHCSSKDGAASGLPALATNKYRALPACAWPHDELKSRMPKLSKLRANHSGGLCKRTCQIKTRASHKQLQTKSWRKVFGRPALAKQVSSANPLHLSVRSRVSIPMSMTTCYKKIHKYKPCNC